ncbi:MAG: ATP-binding protein [Mangrovibacterium sp.]
MSSKQRKWTRMMRKNFWGLLALLFFALAFGTQALFNRELQINQVTRRVRQNFNKITTTGKEEFLEICQLWDQAPQPEQFAIAIDSLKQNGLLGDILILKADSLCYYSSHEICFDESYAASNDICTLPNGIYWLQHQTINNAHLRYFLPLKHHFPIQNNYLNDYYLNKLRMPEGYELAPPSSEGLLIHFPNGSPAFSLHRNELHLGSAKQIMVSIFFILAFVLLLIFVNHHIRSIPISRFLRVGIEALFLCLLYYLHLKTHFPQAIWNLTLAQPTVFATSYFFPSLTALFLFCLLFLTFCVFCFRLIGKRNLNRELSILLFLVLLGSYFGLSHLISSLVNSSNFSMQLNQVNQLSLAGILSYFCISLLFLGCFLLQLRLFHNNSFQPKAVRIFLITAIIGVSIFSINQPCSEGIYLINLFLVSSLAIVLFSESRTKQDSIFYLISFCAIYAIFTLIVLQQLQNKQSQQIRELCAYNKFEGHDAETELRFKSVEKAILNDTIIPDKIVSNDFEFVENYVTHEYLDNLSSQYHIWLSICSPTDDLRIEPEGNYTSCYNFFQQMLKNTGTPILNSSFYRIDTPNGALSYFGQFVFKFDEEKEFTLFLQLESKMKEEGLGFPELLTDRSQLEPQKYADFSFAKYHDCQLISIGGNYPYKFNIEQEAHSLPLGITQLKSNKYWHTIYKSSVHDMVIISSPCHEVWQSIFAFPYIFLFYFLVALGVMFFGSTKKRKLLFNYDLSTRIQLAVVGTLFSSLILVSSSTVWYNLQQYKKQHRKDLDDKMKAISQELNYQLRSTNDIQHLEMSDIWENLGNWSNIFQTDINIYEPNGKLLASSRPALFNIGLSTPQLNSKALQQFQIEHKLSFIQPENIGKLQFLSAYESIINEKGETIGYINLPYFMQSDSLRQDILNFIVAFINLSVFLLLISIIATLALSNQITKPLSYIKESLRVMSISKQNKPINYVGNDEIGELVQEYNNKLVELEESAQLLAKSQREMAWKEMARQVAHEIKNPLTPMKLQIQHLQRTKHSGDMERYNLMFDKVTISLIEQIDRLTSIANSFSQFAKMPEPQPELLNLNELIEKQITLFELNEHLHINFQQTLGDAVWVFADAEQLSRAFLNIIKNAQQSVALGKNAQIDIGIKQDAQSVLVSISDNGSGVPEAIRTRLFEPNFTTKSSGMGLGLAIVKRCIESTKGKIWFESTPKQGTTFFVELPKVAPQP